MLSVIHSICKKLQSHIYSKGVGLPRKSTGKVMSLLSIAKERLMSSHKLVPNPKYFLPYSTGYMKLHTKKYMRRGVFRL